MTDIEQGSDDFSLLDERSIRSDVRSLSNSRSMDKMMSVFYQVKSTREKIDAMKDESRKSLQGPSLASIATNSTISQILLPVESIKKYDMRCWDAFHKYSQPVGDLPLDRCERGLAAHRLFSALDFVSEKVRKMNVDEVIETFQLRPEDTVPWIEFKSFCDMLFEPILDGKIKEDGQKWRGKGLPSTPYTQMMRKQRTVGQMSYADLAGKTSSSTLIRAERVRDVLMPKGDIGNATVRVVRNAGDRHAQSLVRCMNMGSAGAGLPGSSVSHRLLAPLEKSTVSALVDDASHRYSEKWLKMRDMRAHRKASISFRAQRKSTMATMSRQVITQDRTSMRAVLSQADQAFGRETMAKYSRSKEQEAAVRKNIKNWKTANLSKKKKDALNLKSAMEMSIDEARDLLQEEVQFKRETKAPALKLPQYTSTRIEVPSELKDRMRFAKKESEFRDAEKAVHCYVKDELDHRFNTLTKSRSEALIRSMRAGSPVALSPIRGEQFFERSVDDIWATSAPGDDHDDDMLYVDYNTYVKSSAPSGKERLQVGFDDSTYVEGPSAVMMDSISRTYSAENVIT